MKDIDVISTILFLSLERYKLLRPALSYNTDHVRQMHIGSVTSPIVTSSERLTKQVARAISGVLKPQGVGVLMQPSHLCMAIHGVQKVGSTTITGCMLGCIAIM
ncbi:GTP cyclohydrolase 1 [Penicillium psychrosexuale]|uniref:GTP cyclohydrolase 1 n=1 Tax=Penicillium psychrosexuale TaxID=1002107 RepID=UPI002544ECF5|nr:GTP cyclohydrolase 1 [Penicillium psychrosexuale]KAJ5801097.1 GTP cyclohydrolase 1 [Penicillium psychrosexuale]